MMAGTARGKGTCTTGLDAEGGSVWTGNTKFPIYGNVFRKTNTKNTAYAVETVKI